MGLQLRLTPPEGGVDGIYLTLQYLRARIQRDIGNDIVFRVRKVLAKYPQEIRSKENVQDVALVVKWMLRKGLLTTIKSRSPKMYRLTRKGREWAAMCTYPSCPVHCPLAAEGLCPKTYKKKFGKARVNRN